MAAGAQLTLAGLHGQLVVLAQGPEHPAAVLVKANLVRGDVPQKHPQLGRAVVPGLEGQTAVLEIVQPGVPRMGPYGPAAGQGEYRGRGFHGALRGLEGQYPAVGLPDQGSQALRVRPPVPEGADAFRRRRRGQLSAAMPAQAVGQYQAQPVPVPERVPNRVLIPRPPACVCVGCDIQHGCPPIKSVSSSKSPPCSCPGFDIPWPGWRRLSPGPPVPPPGPGRRKVPRG